MKTSMTFSGNSLLRIRYCISLACDEIDNQIATCPDVVHYREDIENAESELLGFKKLLSRIDKKLENTTGVKEQP